MVIHDFRVLDRVLAETDPGAADVVFIGANGSVAAPFLCVRTVGGPGGVYIDALDVIDADGRSLGTWEKRYEIDGESKPRTVVTEFRGVRFPVPGTYTMQYSVYDDVVASFPFAVVQQDSPAAGIVPGPLDAALGKSTLAWVAFGGADEVLPAYSGVPAKEPRYLARTSFPVWYGYEDGRVYVLVGPGEQDVPGLTEAPAVHLIARSKDVQSQVADVECVVQVLPKDARWEEIARDLLLGRRLNLRDGDAAVARWKDTCEIVALTPVPPPVPTEAT